VAGLYLADIQGDILRGYGNRYEHTGYLFFRIHQAGAARGYLRELLSSARITSAVAWSPGTRPQTTLNVAITAAGVEALGAGHPRGLGFSSEFCEGMAARADRLGDRGPSDPTRWEEQLDDRRMHLLATVNALTEPALDSALAQLRAAPGMSAAYEQRTRLLDGAREHFGFADGFGQPAIAGVPAGRDRRFGGGVLDEDGWRPLAPGEFVLGYEDEDTRVDPRRRLPSAPDGAYGRSGTYMVWRKLRQDVALFRRTVREAAARYAGGDEHKLRAKIVGRWPNGSPLTLAPDAPLDPFDAQTDPRANAFGFAREDPDGHRCPVGAHIRRANPRDGLGFETRLTYRHRIIRRGMPYGDPLPDDVTADDGHERGLIFVCFNASLSRQFEAIQSQWLNDANPLHLGHDSDFLLGYPLGTEKMTVQGDPPFLLGPQGPLVTTRGGAYLFVPGLAALAELARD
jgi:Dyp-type peroxidase family